MPKHPEVKINLVGEDGNAFAIMGRVREAMRRAGVSREEQEAYSQEAMSGDYDNLLRVTMDWVSCDEDDEDYDEYEDDDDDWEARGGTVL